ncbi:MAG TPA: TonB family protein [Terriglobales bacterium]|nr:TonB family protein [Terriglobales bacterium]
MAQRALLFSSDPETSRRLAQALRELEFSVDHCSEIFAAVERITSHSFELIVTDWDDGVEGMFLIKTARELRLNCDAFRIVAAKPAATIAATNAGAQIVLPKPILPGHTKYTLLTSDIFVRRMKVWVPDISAEKLAAPAYVPAPAVVEPIAAAVRQAAPVAAPAPEVFQSSWADSPLEENLRADFRFGSLEKRDGFLDNLGIPFHAMPKAKPRLRLLMWGGLLVGGLTAGYVFSGSFNAQASSKSIPSSVSNSAGAATAPAPPLRRDESKLTIRVTPKPEPVAVEPPAEASQGISTTLPEVSASEPVQEAVATPPPPVRASIPASLNAPIEPEVGARATSSKATPLMSGVEPVSLTEDLSEKMLLSRVVPDYPSSALQSRLQGAVLLQAWIRKDGTVRDLKVVNGPLALCEAAYSAVKQWRYKPLQMNGQSVEATTYVTVNFRLP